jgi:hypothetical protein
MDKVINLNKTVTELINEDPELRDIFAGMGLKEAKSPIGLKLIGKSRSLKEEADRRNILPEELANKLLIFGYTVEDREIEDEEEPEEGVYENDVYEEAGEDDRVAMAQKQAELVANELALMAGADVPELPVDRMGLLAKYVRGACGGQNIRKLRKEIAKELGSVTPQEIEQTAHRLLSEGIDFGKVETLCSIDSQLFRGNIDIDAPKSVSQALEDVSGRGQGYRAGAENRNESYADDLLGAAVAADFAEARVRREGVLHFEEGDITVGQLQALLQILPMDLTFIDANDICCFTVQGGGVFGRRESKIGQSVYERHAKNVRPMIRALLDDFRMGRQQSAETWTPDREQPARVRFYAVHDADGRYLGACEIAEDMTSAKRRFVGRRG